jgi:predicted Fe-Mo cluster-binding NifX family protein
VKIAIAATTPDTDAEVSTHGARAPYYLLFDTETSTIKALANPAARAERGAGPKAAAFLLAHGVEQVIAGEFGPKFRAELGDTVSCVEQTGAVSDIIGTTGPAD